MTKAELIETLKDYPDDMEVCADCSFNTRDPAGPHNIEGIWNGYPGIISLIIARD